MTETILIHLDGTVLDSFEAKSWAWFEALRLSGVRCTYQQIEQIIRLTPAEIAQRFGFREEALQKRVIDLWVAIFIDSYLETVKPLPGARELLLELKKTGRPLLACSSTEKVTQALLRQTGLFAFFTSGAILDSASLAS